MNLWILHFLLCYFSILPVLLIDSLSNDLRWMTLAFASLIGLLFCAAWWILKRHKLLRTLFYGAVGVYVGICLLDTFLALFFGQRFSASILFILTESSAREGSEFLAMYATSRALLLPLFIILPFLCLPLITKFSTLYKSVTYILACAAVASGLFAVISGHPESVAHYNQLLTLQQSIQTYRTEIAAYRSLKEGMQKQDLDGLITGNSAAAKKNVVVLILGESTSRNHMGIYGYERDTTPRLQGLAEELLVFDDVVSPHSHTIAALKKLLTFCNQESDQPWDRYPTLINCYRSAGYKTYWLSNQDVFGCFTNLQTALASQADTMLFSDWRSNTETATKYDEVLLDQLDSHLKEDSANKLIILHLMGTHGGYRHRYPSSFERFKASEIKDKGRSFLTPSKKRTINQYDNAVLYNDTIVTSIIERVRQETDISSYVLYLSDHGEEVYDNRDVCGHAEAIGNRFMIEIPFLLWFSKQYKAHFADKVSTAKRSVNNPYQTDDLIHTLLDLSGLESPFFDPTRSVVNAGFDQSRSRIYAGQDYDTVIRPCTSDQLIQFHADKLWAHRVDSLGSLARASQEFAGVEVDLVLQEDENGAYFDVGHPPVKSIGLTLDMYLDSVQHDERLQFWLDIKNLKADNAEKALHRLQILDKRYSIANRSIVESHQPELLAQFTEAGFQTSYYLSYLRLEEMSEAEQTAAAKTFIDRAKGSPITGLSFPGYMYSFVKEQVHPHVQDKKLFTWEVKDDPRKVAGAKKLQPLVNDPSVGVVLVKYRTKYDR